MLKITQPEITSAPLTMAEQADKFDCYQKSVQSPKHEVEFFEQAYRDVAGSKPRILREDFCGTFAVCCTWVKSRIFMWSSGFDMFYLNLNRAASQLTCTWFAPWYRAHIRSDRPRR